MADNQSKPQLSLDKNQPSAKPKETVSEQITYLPGPDDPSTTKWRGYLFQANVPKTVAVPEMIEQARGNKFFHVGPFDPAKDSVKVVPSEKPTTPEQYRSYAVEWFKRVKTLDEFDTRWMAEEVLREKCGVGTDDIDYLMSLIQPKRAELKKQSMAA